MITWVEIYATEIKKDYFKKLISFVHSKNKIHPDRKDIFNAFKYCSLENVKVVILGQDPYHGPGQAHGLSFSVSAECDIPPSLRNIYKEITNDLGITKFENGCLKQWATQGVLLLNSIMTVDSGKPGSHKNQGWEIFTDNIIKLLNEINKPIVFLVWGSFARNKKILLNNKMHLILEAPHPSPLSAYNGFFGCKHFSKTNKFLIENNIEPIDWKIGE